MDLITPAPILRRLASALYDGLLLIALFLVGLLISVVTRDALGLQISPRNWNHYCRALGFVIGLIFCGWFWTHGGQTVGMVAWRLQVRREDGAPLRWPIAAIRYSAMLLSWTAAVLPLFLLLPRSPAIDSLRGPASAAAVLLALGWLAMRLDGRRRAPHDRVSGCEVVLLPPRRKAEPDR
jgi:uncharacterized RDD family membrane protein YckC